MALSPDIVSHALFQSLVEGPLLLKDLPEGAAFACRTLVPPKKGTLLNFQQKLGHLYEEALAVMLDSTARYDSLAQGVQIRREAGQTIGELDFLIKDLATGRLIHLELAVKFYLAVETESGVLLPGPDARDNYFRKLEKMRSHQLMLVDKFRNLLPEKFRGEKIEVQQLVHGCIFNHVSANAPVEAEFLNPAGRRGLWLHANECADYFGNNTLLEIIPKPLWPVPLEILKGTALEKWKQDDKIDRCVMLRVGAGNTPYFIAPKQYPLHRNA